jgi:glutaconate CoA-transferase subunit A
MNPKKNKILPLSEAIKRYVQPGAHISVGGFTLNRNPMAAVYEIIRQGIKGLHLYAHSNGQAIDELIGSDCVDRLEIAYGGNGKYATTCIRFRRAVEKGLIQVEDYSNYMMGLRFLAGAMGVPFLPTLSGLGSDLISKWGFSAALRLAESRLPNDKLKVMENPFGGWGGTSKVVLVPAINPDVTIIHVQQADPMGTCRIKGLTFADVEQAKASRNVIVTCEEIVSTDVLQSDPDRNQLPFIHVSAICRVSHGAYPCAVYQHYDYDARYLRDYASAAKNDLSHKQYQEKYILGVKDHQEFLDLVGFEHLETIEADPRTGYATNMRRA